MILQKLSAFLLVVGLTFQTTACAAATEARDAQDGALTAELKQNALQLLASVAREIGQFKLAENRVRARTIAADLLWEHDEPAARTLNQYAFTELRNLLVQSDAERAEKSKNDETSDYYVNRFRLNELRREYVLTLAARDSAAAVNALSSLKTKPSADWDPLAERLPLLKFETATVIAAKDPNRAYAVYKEEIAAGGITVPLLESFDELHRKNPELTAKIFRDIFAVVKTANIKEFSNAGNPTKIVAANAKQIEIEFWQATAFLNAASKLKRRTERDQKTLPPPLAEAELKELSELLARQFLNTPNPAKNVINQAMTAITRHAPEQVRDIRQKVGAEGVRAYETVMESDAYYLSLEEKTADELAREADRAADADKRDLLYEAAARKALAEGEAEKAQAIAARIKNRDGYAGLIEKIEIEVPLAAARRGDQTEVRKLLAGLKPGEKRIAVLTELASALAAKGEHAAAKKLLDEAIENLFTASPANESDQKPDIESHLEIAGKFAAVSVVVAPDEAFTNLETIIEAVNAEIKSVNSSDKGAVKTKEFFYDAMERELLRHTPQTIKLLQNMARADCERTVKLIEKFERPEIRLFARLRLAQALLDSQAAAREKETLEQFLAEMDGEI